MKITNSLLYKEYINRENELEHAPYHSFAVTFKMI